MIRNVAIIAHVDHGKTTLVDGLLKQSNTFRKNEAYMSQELILDSNDQERERGITILAKNTSVYYKGVKINIIDTPGHADFSGEVERTLSMAEGAILLVDAKEGPMPQTKFVLKKALELELKVIVLINKIDKKNADVKSTINEIYNLFLGVAKNVEQLDFSVLYAIGREGKAWKTIPKNLREPADLTPVFDAILKYVPKPKVETNKPFQMLVSSLYWDSYKGQYALGKVIKGKITPRQKVFLIKPDGTFTEQRISKIFVTNGLKRVEANSFETGDIISITGINDVKIGDTVSAIPNPENLSSIKISEPTISISIGPNKSPFVGNDGALLTSRQLLKRIQEELKTNVAMKMSVNESNQYVLSGRGELHICVFLEALRREGFEIEICKPKVILKEINRELWEPVEEYVVDVPSEYADSVIAEFARRSGLLISQKNGLDTRLIFEIPTRSILGMRSLLLSISKGTAISGSVFLKYQKANSSVKKMRKGALIASKTGRATAYAINSIQDRGVLFIDPGIEVYAGMVIGLNARMEDLEVNVCKEKHLTNMRSKGEASIILNSSQKMSLEKCFGFIEDDELLEITPNNLRIRKKILNALQRKRATKDV